MDRGMKPLSEAPLLVVGAGVMGAGIAQVAAQAGHAVLLFDQREAAPAEARTRIAAALDGRVAKGQLSAQAARAALARIEPVATLAAAANAGFAIEAIVEELEAKRALLRQIEAILRPDAVLATNTSSISITAIANGLRRPERLVGMHFFNPAPQMKLVEVVSGLHTDPAVADLVFDFAKSWGKVPVHTKSTPGFIVNRIARPFYAETLALLQENAAEPEALDACLRAAGFRMGPCELMDLIGHDVNFAVTSSVYAANFYDKRYVPSALQRELIEGGLLGRKSGRGFYRYPEGAPALAAASLAALVPARVVSVHGKNAIAQGIAAAAEIALSPLGRRPAIDPASSWTGLEIDGARLVLTDGRPAFEVARQTGLADIAVFDRPVLLPVTPGQPLAYAINAGAGAPWKAQAPAWLAALGFRPLAIADSPGLVVARTLAMLINEAADAVLAGVCSPDSADAAMKLGVNYPAGPFEWLNGWSAREVMQILEALDAAYRGERYRVSPWLRRNASA
jgi:3-hydroxybutyryl-CoA dehydrogenase